MDRVRLSSFVLLLLSAAVTWAENSTVEDVSRFIIGGAPAGENEFPWQAALQVTVKKNIWSKPVWQHHCGASVVRDKWLVTAAHCFLISAKSADYRVVTGSLKPLDGASKSRQISKIAQFILHPQWRNGSAQNDIALIKLTKPLKFGSAVSNISIPRVPESFYRSNCVATGWGRTTPKGFYSMELLIVELPIMPNALCTERYRRFVKITSNQLCAGRLDEAGFGPCTGDSGGPLACLIHGSYVLAGVTSFTAECGSKDYPTVFTRLSSYATWIDQILSAND